MLDDALDGRFAASRATWATSQSVFQDSLLFPFALSLIGVAIIAAGLLYHARQAAIAAWLAHHLPDAVARLRPAHAR